MHPKHTLQVLESFISVSGTVVGIVVKCDSVAPTAGCILSSPEGKKWRVVRILQVRSIKKLESENIFPYQIEGINVGSNEGPSVGQILSIAN